MDEKPKSIWKKSFAGRTALVVWLAVVVFAFMLCCFIGALVNYNNYNWFASDALETAGIFAGGFLVVCLILIYIVWPLLRWLFWKHWRRTFFALACLATLIALFYAEEDWRGLHDWNKFKREWEAKGEKFDYASIIPPPVPDDQNFAFSTVWIAEEKYLFQKSPERAKAWYGDRIYSEEVSNLLSLMPVSVSGLVGTNIWRSSTPEMPDNWMTAHAIDLKPWQSYYRNLESTNPAAEIPVATQPQSPAQDVLLALGKFDPLIEQLRQDSARPDSRFPIQYDGMPAAILLPHLAAEKRYLQVLQLHAIAELQNGENEKALDDVKLMLRLTDASCTEPFLISQLVRIAILNLTLQPVYEGLAEHKWSDAQLADLDSELAKLDFLSDYEFAMRGERALAIANIEFLRHPTQNPQFKRPHFYFIVPLFYLLQGMSGYSSDEEPQMKGFQMLALSLGPSGWVDQNELRIARFDTKWYLPIADQETKTISPAKTRATGNALRQEIRHQTPENVLETVFLPGLGNSVVRFAYAQSSMDLARVAIALERYRLAHGEFPESLDAVASQFPEGIPHDIINGGPLHYRLASNGQFVLYSVGWNETDDGGVVVLKKGPTGEVDRDEGDWVWRYPKVE